jgi:hypothetical protein
VCGGLLEGPTGVFESPEYPSTRGYRRICRWEIVVPIGRRVKVELLDFDLDTSVEAHKHRIIVSCTYFVSFWYFYAVVIVFECKWIYLKNFTLQFSCYFSLVSRREPYYLYYNFQYHCNYFNLFMLIGETVSLIFSLQQSYCSFHRWCMRVERHGGMMFRISFWDDDGGSTHLWNVGRELFYTAVHPRRQFRTSYSPPWELEISHGGMILTGENWRTLRKPVPVTFCSPQISHG